MTFRDAFTPLNIVLVLLIAAATVTGFVLIPPGTILPVHWGISGEPDGFLPRDAALLLLPAIALAIMVLLLVVLHFAGAKRARAARHAMAAVIPALLGLFLTIAVAIIMIGMGIAVDMVRVVVLGLGVLFAILGNIMPKTQPNGVAGIRLPWTLRDPANWQATNRLAGLLMLAGGLVMVVAAFVTGNSGALLIVTAAAVLLPLIITSLYSYRFAHPNQSR